MCHERQISRLRILLKRLARAKPVGDPNDAAVQTLSAAEELARREAAAAAAAEALLDVRAVLPVLLCQLVLTHLLLTSSTECP